MLVNIDVPDLEAAIAFYQCVANLSFRRRLFNGSVAELTGAPVPVFLLQKDEGGSASAAASLSRDFRRHWTPIHLDFVVDDVDIAIRRAVAAGAKLEGTIQRHPWGRLAVLSDPFGHGFCLLQWSGEGYDEIA